MKTYLLFILCLCLAGTIVAPSFIALMSSDEELELTLEQGMDDNKKESKEGEKESSDKDCYYYYGPLSLTDLDIKASIAASNYVEGQYGLILNIFLPPPELS